MPTARRPAPKSKKPAIKMGSLVRVMVDGEVREGRVINMTADGGLAVEWIGMGGSVSFISSKEVL